ncbi:MAG: hypothetical protein WB615_11215 [Candidatus Tumulicola sp.]
MYNVYAWDEKHEHACQSFYYFAVLPGDSRTIAEQMADCCGDPISRLFIVGEVQVPMQVSVTRLEGSPPCGTVLAVLHKSPIDVEQDRIGFYATDNRLSGDAAGSGAVFGVELKRPDGDTRTLRIVADYPSEFLSTLPTLTSINLTADLVSAVFKAPAEQLVCLKGNDQVR